MALRLFTPTLPPPTQAERLQALYTIRPRAPFVCLDCAGESSKDSSMLTLPLPLFDAESNLLRTLVRGFSR